MAELIREAALEGVRDESPHPLAVVIDDAILYVERDRQNRIVIGKGGAWLREVGTAAHTQIEKLLGPRLYLDLRVKVQELAARPKTAWPGLGFKGPRSRQRWSSCCRPRRWRSRLR